MDRRELEVQSSQKSCVAPGAFARLTRLSFADLQAPTSSAVVVIQNFTVIHCVMHTRRARETFEFYK